MRDARAEAVSDFFQPASGQSVNLCALRHQITRHVRIGEERHRRPRSRQHQMPCAPELFLRHFGEVAETWDIGHASAPRQPGGKRFHKRLCSGRSRDAGRRTQACGGRRRPAEQQDHLLAIRFQYFQGSVGAVQVHFYRSGRDGQFLCNLAVGVSLRDERHDLPLP